MLKVGERLPGARVVVDHDYYEDGETYYGSYVGPSRNGKNARIRFEVDNSLDAVPWKYVNLAPVASKKGSGTKKPSAPAPSKPVTTSRNSNPPVAINSKKVLPGLPNQLTNTGSRSMARGALVFFLNPRTGAIDVGQTLGGGQTFKIRSPITSQPFTDWCVPGTNIQLTGETLGTFRGNPNGMLGQYIKQRYATAGLGADINGFFRKTLKVGVRVCCASGGKICIYGYVTRLLPNQFEIDVEEGFKRTGQKKLFPYSQFFRISDPKAKKLGVENDD